MQDIIRVSTDLVEPDQRTDYWRDVTRPLFDSLPHEGGLHPALEGRYETRLTGSLMTGCASFGPQRFVRDWRVVSQSGLEDFCLVQLFSSGAARLDCEGLGLSIAAGDVYIFDLGRTFSSQYDAGSTLSVVLRRDRLEKIMGGRSLHGILFKAGQPQTRLLADFITGLMHLGQEVTDASASATEDAVVALLALAMHRNPVVAMPDATAFAPILRRRVLDFIDANLATPALDLKMLMQRFRVSRAHLYRVFEIEGGIARAVRERRLDAAYRLLLRAPATSIPELSEQLGFSGADQFQKAFRNRFGMTPNEARQERAKLIVEDGQLTNLQNYLARYQRWA